MVEIKFRDQFEVADLAGKTVSEAREQFHDEFGIPVKASAKLNGETVKGSAEIDTVLADDDKLTFAVSRHVGLYLVGAALLALAVTGSVFAFGFINASTSLGAHSVDSNFADVTANLSGSSNCSWNAWGYYKGTIDGPNNIFNITPGPGFTGDIVTTVTIANADQLVKRYRVLVLELQMVDLNTGLAVNVDGTTGPEVNPYTLLTLDNGSASLFTAGTSGSDNMTVQVKSGFYITQAFPGTWLGAASPDLFCEVAQR